VFVGKNVVFFANETYLYGGSLLIFVVCGVYMKNQQPVGFEVGKIAVKAIRENERRAVLRRERKPFSRT
jgi:hypothetical protein